MWQAKIATAFFGKIAYKHIMIVDVAKAVEILHEGDVVGMPTETVYGLAARIDKIEGIRQIFRVKNRPFFDPLILHVHDIGAAKRLTTDWSPLAQALAEKYWPGPLTLVLPKTDVVSDLITAGLPSVGIRCPRHPVALQLIAKAGVPLAAPSANKFGRTSPTQASHVLTEFAGDSVAVVDGGPCEIGLESTVLSIENGKRLAILREGAILRSELSRYLMQAGIEFEFAETAPRSASPGHTKHHYMPSSPLIVCMREPDQAQEFMAFALRRLQEMPDEIEGIKITKPQQLGRVNRLQLSMDPALAAREFYSKLREVAADKPDAILFVKPDFMHGEVWAALWNRLSKAASLIANGDEKR